MERSGDQRDRAELVRDRPSNHPTVEFSPGPVTSAEEPRPIAAKLAGSQAHESAAGETECNG